MCSERSDTDLSMIQQRMFHLNAGEGCPSFTFCNIVHFYELPGMNIGGAKVLGLSREYDVM